MSVLVCGFDKFLLDLVVLWISISFFLHGSDPDVSFQVEIFKRSSKIDDYPLWKPHLFFYSTLFSTIYPPGQDFKSEFITLIRIQIRYLYLKALDFETLLKNGILSYVDIMRT